MQQQDGDSFGRSREDVIVDPQCKNMFGEAIPGSGNTQETALADQKQIQMALGRLELFPPCFHMKLSIALGIIL